MKGRSQRSVAVPGGIGGPRTTTFFDSFTEEPIPDKIRKKKMAAAPRRKFRELSGPHRTNFWIHYLGNNKIYSVFCLGAFIN